MTPPWTIYGANGYTGTLIAEEAVRRGLAPVLAGRNARAVDALGRRLDLPVRVFDLHDAAANLDDMDLVLHCAGPFSATSAPLLDACLHTHTHYLDITGEIAVFEAIHSRSEAVRTAGIVALPGVGFDVVPSDCLAALLHRALPEAVDLRLAFTSRHGHLSPGTTRTMIEGLPTGTQVRRHGRIVRLEGEPPMIQAGFTDGSRTAVAVSWGDVATAFYSTGIPNITVYLGTSPAMLKGMRRLDRLRPLLSLGPANAVVKHLAGARVRGPTGEQRDAGQMLLWGEVRDAAGQSVTMRLRTPEGYAFTADAAVTVVERVLRGELEPGVYTPSQTFGADFVLSLSGVVLTR